MSTRTGVMNSHTLLTLLGRVGEKGQDNLDFYGRDLNSALHQFNAKFRAKTKLHFQDRQGPSKPGFWWSFVLTDLQGLIHILSVRMKKIAAQTQQ